MQDGGSRRLESRKIEISHDVTEWSLSRPLSWTLTVLTFAVHLRIYCASNLLPNFVVIDHSAAERTRFFRDCFFSKEL